MRSPFAGKIELISATTGHVGVREAPTPVERDAYIRGTVVRVIPKMRAWSWPAKARWCRGFSAWAANVRAKLSSSRSGPDNQPLTDALISESHRGKIIVGGSNVSGAALRKAAQVGVVGIVAGGVIDRELMDYLAEALNQPGYDIGVAITGQEPIAFTLMITEGFGEIAMSNRAFALFQSLQGETASINGATQIRAGVIRPEVIVPLSDTLEARQEDDAEGGQLSIGTPIRVIREPYFGILGTVSGLPTELVKVESETMVRVLETHLADGRTVTVPRANVEIIETN